MKKPISFVFILAAGCSLTYLFCLPTFAQDFKKGVPESKQAKASSDSEAQGIGFPPIDLNYEPTAEEILRMEIYETGNRPSRRFQLISPVSAKEETEEKSFAKLKLTAVKMHADAIIDYQCGPATEQSKWSGFFKVRAYCNGKAVKWMK